MAPSAAAAAVRELEKRFVCPSHILSAVAAVPPTLAVPSGWTSELISGWGSLDDEYFDHLPTLKLCTSGCWLRKRNGEWELKRSSRSSVREDVDAYEELTGKDALRVAAEVLGARAHGALLQEAPLESLAVVRSNRISFNVRSGGGCVTRVDIDKTELPGLPSPSAYCLLEIEAVTPNSGEGAADAIDETAAALTCTKSGKNKLFKVLEESDPLLLKRVLGAIKQRK
mmetsp:Transcript_46501/g.119996  ORF Transcript_46501/g.119996 Transcript_46501/m.119996 type:complete len:227 (-) Transcript_46501:1952-2632(-)